MALEAELLIEGLTVEGAYWRIGEFYWNGNDPVTLNFRIDGYASHATYQAGLGAIASKIVQIEMNPRDPNDKALLLFNQVRAMAYGIIKGLEQFEGSTDA